MATEISGFDLGSEIKERMCRIRDYVPRTNTEAAVLSFLDDLCRKESRYADKHPLAKYPEVGEAAAPYAPWHIVRGPLSAVEGHLWERFFAPSLPCLWEAVSREKQSNHEEDCATHNALRKDTDVDRLRLVRDALDVQMAESQVKRAVVDRRIKELSK